MYDPRRWFVTNHPAKRLGDCVFNQCDLMVFVGVNHPLLFHLWVRHQGVVSNARRDPKVDIPTWFDINIMDCRLNLTGSVIYDIV